jgi:hypothetical protein
VRIDMTNKSSLFGGRKSVVLKSTLEQSPRQFTTKVQVNSQPGFELIREEHKHIANLKQAQLMNSKTPRLHRPMTTNTYQTASTSQAEHIGMFNRRTNSHVTTAPSEATRELAKKRRSAMQTILPPEITTKHYVSRPVTQNINEAGNFTSLDYALN